MGVLLSEKNDIICIHYPHSLVIGVVVIVLVVILLRGIPFAEEIVSNT